MIHPKTPREIMIMAEGGKILAEILKKVSQAVKPGTTTKELDKIARELVLYYKVKPAFLGYNNFPAVLCVSVNDEVVHGVPSERVLRQGDIVGLDMGIFHKNFATDSALTVPVLGELTYLQWSKKNSKLAQLIETAKHALNSGIKKAVIGNHVGTISHEIQNIVENAGFGAVRDLAGHGIGRELHEDPNVPNFGKIKDGPELTEGIVIAIEPMISAGDWRIKLSPDQMTYATQDGSFSAHFEHTVAITKDGPLVLT